MFILSDVSLRESEALYNSFKLPVVSCRGDNMYMFSILSCNFPGLSLSLTVFAPCFYYLYPGFSCVMQAKLLLDGFVRSVRTYIYACTCHPPYGEL